MFEPTPRGLSVIELLVVVAVIAVIAATAPLVLPTDRFAVSQAVERFEADLRRARFDAVRTNQVVVFEFNVENGRYAAVGERTGRELFSVDVAAGTGLFTTSSTALRIRFDPRGISYFVDAAGSARAPGETISVTFEHSRGASSSIDVNSYGRVRRG